MAKILLIDDDNLMVRMYQTKFEADGYEVETGSNGKEALTKARSSKPDLILMDVMMPEMNGFEALKELKEHPETKNIPVVLLTNVGGTKEDTEKGLELGAVAYIVKASYTPKQVVEKVKEILGGYKQELPEVKVELKE